MTEQTPLAATGKKGKVRAQMWHDAFEAHQAGRVRVVELRASDYVGPGANAVLGDRVVPRVLKGQAVTLLGRTDRPRTWSYTGDVATMAVLVAATSGPGVRSGTCLPASPGRSSRPWTTSPGWPGSSRCRSGPRRAP